MANPEQPPRKVLVPTLAEAAEIIRIQDAEKLFLELELEERDKKSGIDHLTGVAAREILEAKLEDALKIVRGDVEVKRGSDKPLKELSLIYVDIDHFKNVNDTFGHPVGDKVLRGVAAVLMESVRISDIVARFGGEEFMVLMPSADEKSAARHAEKLRTKIERLTFPAHPELKVTASFGVVSSNSSAKAEELYGYADKALYVAKRGGRNRVETYTGA